MSSTPQHLEYSESLAAYVLGALPEPESARLKHHLTDCQECRAEFERLRVTAEALLASVPSIQPPPELKVRVMELVNAEAELLRAAGEAADRPPARQRSVSWRWRWPSAAVLRPAVGLALAVAVAAVVLVISSGSGPSARSIQARVLGSGAASLSLHGTQADLVVSGLRPPPADHVDELWVKRGSGPPRPAGTFVLGSGAVRLQRPVRPGDLVLVTVEPGQGTPAPTTSPFVVAHA